MRPLKFARAAGAKDMPGRLGILAKRAKVPALRKYPSPIADANNATDTWFTGLKSKPVSVKIACNKTMRSNPARAWDAAHGVHKPNPFSKQFKDAASVLSRRQAKTDHVTLARRRAWKYKVQDPISPAPRVSFVTWA